MKKLTTLLLTIVLAAGLQAGYAQEAKEVKKIYNPEANAGEEISKAVNQAKAEGKHVIIQIGGNWCGWCLLFHEYINTDADIKKFLADNYIFTLLNYSKENKNIDLLTKYRNPGRMGYPVFVVLDGNGNMIHTQDSGLLEEGKGYNKVKVMGFLRNWTVAALDTKNIK